MTHRRLLRLLLPLTVAATALLVPANAHAILVGMESNRELVNTTQTAEMQAEALQTMKEQGVQVVRVNWRWYEIAEGCAGQSISALRQHTNPCYDWSRLDTLVKEASRLRMNVLLSVQQNPSWLSGTTNRYYMGGSWSQFQRTANHFAAFHRAAATRYKPGNGNGVIKFWTVHNEPNSKVYWGSKPNPARYAYLYARTAVQIKLGNKSALVAPGPTGPTGGSGGIKPLAFVRSFQKNVVKWLPGGRNMAIKRRYINAWAHNPYPAYNNQPSFSRRVQHRDHVTMGTIDKLFTQLDRSPVTRRTKVWATEFGWETAPESIRRFGVTTSRQAQYVAEAFDWLDSKRLGRIGRVQIGVSYGMTDPEDVNDWQSGTIAFNGTRKLSFKMFQNMVSVPQAGNSGRVRANTRVRVWGRSNAHPGGTQLAYRILGRKCNSRVKVSGFCPVPRQRGVVGTFGAKYGYVTIRKGWRVDFATYDRIGKQYGPTRRVIGR